MSPRCAPDHMLTRGSGAQKNKKTKLAPLFLLPERRVGEKQAWHISSVFLPLHVGKERKFPLPAHNLYFNDTDSLLTKGRQGHTHTAAKYISTLHRVGGRLL